MKKIKFVIMSVLIYLFVFLIKAILDSINASSTMYIFMGLPLIIGFIYSYNDVIKNMEK